MHHLPSEIGTAMGTSFSGIFAVIFMIRLESLIVNDVRFRRYLRLYKRFIDDLFLIWTGPATVLCDFRRALMKQSAWNRASTNITRKLQIPQWWRLSAMNRSAT